MEKSGFYNQNLFRETAEDSNNQSFAIELVEGHDCQLDCACCYKRYEDKDKTNGRIPFDTVRDYIHQAALNGFKELVLIGGEPTLHPNVFEIIEEIRNSDMTPILCTNGIKFKNKAMVNKLSDTGTTVVTHAYYPGGEERIDEFSGARGYSQILKRAIDNLKQEAGLTIVLEMPLYDSMFEGAFEFFKHCRESGVIPFVELSRANDKGASTSSITPEQIAELFGRFKEFDEKNFPDLADKVICPPAYGNKCTMSMTGLHVKNFGNGDHGKVYSCCAQGISHGDLTQQPLEEILRSPTLSIFRDQDKYIVGPCSDCDIYEICKGGCRGEAYLKFGCPRASSPNCHRISENVRNDISLMAPSSCEGCPAENCDQCKLLTDR